MEKKDEKREKTGREGLNPSALLLVAASKRS
jgi:hypothetical protein